MKSKAAANSSNKTSGAPKRATDEDRPMIAGAADSGSADKRATNAATSPPQPSTPSWARYIDSRLKQFSLR